MANLSKKKGTAAETRVCKYLAQFGIVATRKALAGSNDLGDLEVKAPNFKGKLIFEVKAGKQTSNPNRSQISEWLRQTEVEAENARCKGMLCVVRFNRAIKDADVYWQMPDQKYRKHMYLEEFCELYGRK